MRASFVLAICVAACSSPSNGTHDMQAGGSGGGEQDLSMMSVTDMTGMMTSGDQHGGGGGDMTGRSHDLAGCSGGGSGCAAFLTCIANCASPNGCVGDCRAQVRQCSLPVVMSLVDCAAASCLTGPNHPCATWDDTSDVTCSNCEYGELMPTANPNIACPTQYQACSDDT